MQGVYPKKGYRREAGGMSAFMVANQKDQSIGYLEKAH